MVNVPPLFFNKSGTGGSPFQLSVVISCCDRYPFITIKNHFHRLAFLFKNKIFLQLKIGYNFFYGKFSMSFNEILKFSSYYFCQDSANNKGGKWIVRLKKGLGSRCWENLILAMLGEQFMVGEEICGAVISIRYQV